MKKLFLVLVVTFIYASCEDNCTQDALSERITSGMNKGTSSKGDKVWVCHNGNSLEINVDSLQDHLSHGDTEGECGTLSSDGLNFSDGKIVEIDCDYNLPFLHTDLDGNKWWFSEPK